MQRHLAGALRATRMAKVVLSVVVATLSVVVAVVPAEARSQRDRTAPTAPSNLTADAGDQKVDLAWGASSDNFAVKGYRVYRNQTLVGSVSGTTRFYTDAPLTNGVSETYTVKAYDRAGNLSATSNPATATPVASRDTSAPTSPTGLTATAGDASVQLAWTKATDNVGVTAYRVFRGGIQVASVNASTLSYTDTGLMNGTTYSYTAVAVDAAGNVSSPSNTATATPAGAVAPSPPPSTPSATCASQVFCGDLETGNYSQYAEHEWSEGPFADQPATYTINNVGHSECDIVRSPVHQGSYASRCQVKPTTGTSSTDRAEALGDSEPPLAGSSQVWFYGWWSYFPGPSQDWKPNYTFNDFTQFGQYPNGLSGANWLYFGVDSASNPGTPRIYAQYVDEQTGINPLPTTVLADPLQYDHWYHFIVQARWSQDPSQGQLAIWVDGVNKVPLRTGIKTLSGTADHVDLGQGLYRGAYSSTNTVVHDGLCRATTFADASAC
jgi:chitodextrinase